MPHHSTIVHPAPEPLKAKFPDIKFLARTTRYGDGCRPATGHRPSLHLPSGLTKPSIRHAGRNQRRGLPELSRGQHRFGVNYGLTSVSHNNRLWLKVFFDPTLPTAPKTAPRDEEILERGDPGLKVDSVTGVWPGAEWLEREVYDMIGIIFVGHPDLHRILTWNGYGSYPLRKDYPLRGSETARTTRS